MVVGLGIDLVELDRVAAALARWGARLPARLMDGDEARLLPQGGSERARALALAIAAKEAASKALGTGFSRGVRWRDLRLDPGPPPRVRLLARALEVARALGSSGETEASFELSGNLVVGEVRLLA